MSLVADADDLPEHGAGVVTLMTLHTAKGLEFPVVFVTGWEDGMFPHMRALGDPAELSEERRLAYVGITRARQRLYLSRAKVRSSWGQPMLNPESRFLREIPQDLIDWRRTDPAPSLSAPVSGAGRFGHPRPSPARTAAAGKRPLLVLEPGDRVTHDKYGLGRVEEVSGVGESAMSLIDFGSAGRVKLMHNHAPVRSSSARRARLPAGRARPGSAPAAMLPPATPGSRTPRRQFRARDEQAREDHQRHDRAHHDQQTPILRRSSSAIKPPMVAAADTAVKKPDRHTEQPVGVPPRR